MLSFTGWQAYVHGHKFLRMFTNYVLLRTNKKGEKFRAHYCYVVCVFLIDIFNVFFFIFILYFPNFSFFINLIVFIYYSHNCTLFIQPTPVYINHVTEAHRMPPVSIHKFFEIHS